METETRVLTMLSDRPLRLLREAWIGVCTITDHDKRNLISVQQLAQVYCEPYDASRQYYLAPGLFRGKIGETDIIGNWPYIVSWVKDWRKDNPIGFSPDVAAMIDAFIEHRLGEATDGGQRVPPEDQAGR